jgi:hypothetical protein
VLSGANRQVHIVQHNAVAARDVHLAQIKKGPAVFDCLCRVQLISA